MRSEKPSCLEGFFCSKAVPKAGVYAGTKVARGGFVEKRLILSKRLSCLGGWVAPGARLVDVGTDHGFLPVSLLLEGVCQRAIAADIGSGPLQNARKTAERYGVLERMTFITSDGLEQISPEEVDTVVMAGMGGETMIHILEGAPWVNDPRYTLLLQPMSKAELLRSFLYSHGYEVERERLVEEPPFLYHVLLAKGGCLPKQMSDPLLRYGSAALWSSKDPLLGTYCDGLIGRLSRAIEGLQKSEKPEDTARRRAMEEDRAALIRKRREL
ncbi:MAG: class I SAM-dependent methyltransferase [Oscillospiraceae bacterium]|jgi:tRNA (adenine22-N1)-methyltransferase